MFVSTSAAVVKGPRIFVQATRVLLLILATLVTSTSLHAQFDQWVEPGSLSAIEVDLKAELDKAVEEARWKLGGLRLHPWVSLHNAAYVDNVFATSEGEESDMTATLGAGLRGYVPIGSSSFFAIHALPEYVWWQDLADRRRLDGRYGVGFFSFGSRSEIQLTATRAEQQGIVTSESQQLIHSRTDQAHASLDIDLVRSLGVFVAFTFSEFENLLDETPSPLVPSFLALDRQEEVGVAALRVRLGDTVEIRAGVEDSRVTHGSSNADRSNSGLSPTLSLSYQGPNFSSIIQLADRDLEPEGPTSEFVPFNDLTGTLRLSSAADKSLSFSAYASRNLIYSIDASYSHFVDERLGLALRLALGERIALSVFGELGEQDYAALPGIAVDRLDDMTSEGVSMTFELGLGAQLLFEAMESEYDSNLDTYDRTSRSVGFTFSLGELAWP